VNAPIQPLEGWVLVEPIEVTETTTKSGLIVRAEKSEEENLKNKGTVLATPKESPVSVGCTIYYKNYAGQIVYADAKKYLLIEFQDLCGVLKE